MKLLINLNLLFFMISLTACKSLALTKFNNAMEEQGLYYSVHGQNFQEGSIVAIDINRIDGRRISPRIVRDHMGMINALNIDKDV